MNRFTKSIINELKLSIFNETKKPDRMIVLYPGRFQPMSRHHYEAYKRLVKEFGVDDVYIVTSDVTNTTNSPFSFAEKKQIINRFGIKNVVEIKNPYSPSEFLEKNEQFDPSNTTVVYAIGEKDRSRLGKRAMKFNYTTYIPLKDMDDPYMYYTIIPNIKIEIPGYGSMSGTSVRNALGDTDIKLAELKERFKFIFGWFDPKIFNLVINKLNPKKSKIRESMVGDWASTIMSMTKQQYLMFFDLIKTEYSDTKELLPIIQKWATKKHLTSSERNAFKKQMVDIAKIMGLGAVAFAPVPASELLIPVIIKVGKRYGVNVLPEKDEPKNEELSGKNTIVRRNFWNEVFNGVVNDGNKQLLTCGGAAGHMLHPFEDMNMTFGQLKDMFRICLSGEINSQGISEKVDGQNLFVTLRGNNLYSARNGSDIKKGGMSISQLADKFLNRGDVEQAFNYAARDLQEAFRKLTDKQKQLIFKDGTVWINLEVMYPASANTINYDGAYLVFHNAAEYNSTGEKIADYPKYASILSGMIRQINADQQATYLIRKPKPITIDVKKNFSKRVEYYVQKLDSIQKLMDCKDTDKVAIWHKRWWDRFIKKNTKKFEPVLDPVVLEGLIYRWAFNDKTMALNSDNIKNPELLAWAKDYNKNKYEAQFKKNMEPFENLILKFGAEILSNARDVIAVNPSKSAQKLRDELTSAITRLANSDNPSDLAVLKTQLKRIEAAGGISKIVPIEGIVFKYNNKTYKLTGLFAPINKILAYFKYA